MFFVTGSQGYVNWEVWRVYEPEAWQEAGHMQSAEVLMFNIPCSFSDLFKNHDGVY